ncbi:MAG: alpha/beta-hydrolase family protein [Actinomycetes bacterium]
MDHSAGTGVIGAAFAIARSYQPNLLTRASRDQAIITGVTSAGAYGVFSAGDSVLGAVASRISRTEEAGSGARLLVAGVAGAASAGVALALPWQEHESSRRAIGRLLGQTTAAIAAASIVTTAVNGRTPGLSRKAAFAAAAAVGVGSWLSLRPWQQRTGSWVDTQLPGAIESDGHYFLEDKAREVSPAQSAAIGLGVAAVTYGLAVGESALTGALAKAATVVVGGEPQDHRMLGRVTSAALTVGTIWFGVAQVSALLSKGGGAIEPGMSTPPQAAEITGSPASGIDWTKVTREGARWLGMTLQPENIASIMGVDSAKQPIRVYASLDMTADDEERARILLSEIDRTKALERKAFALFSPTGSGYVNYVANETFEYLMLGDCASAAIQYSVLPSALSLTRVPTGTAQTLMVMRGIAERLMAMPADKRPKVFLFGESLGSQVSQEMFRGTGMLGLEGTGVDAAVWIGTPAATQWRKEIWGTRTVAEAPGVGPGAAYLPRNLVDWRALPQDQREQVKYLLLMNGDDPIPKFGAQVAWRKPEWLGPDDKRPFGAPHGTRWLPGMTVLTTFFDMQNALVPTPGVFAEGGHDYRDVLPQAIRDTWRLSATDEQMARVNAALRQRELAWELYRDWTSALAKPADKLEAAKAKVLKTASNYTGRSIDEAELHRIIDEGLQPK